MVMRWVGARCVLVAALGAALGVPASQAQDSAPVGNSDVLDRGAAGFDYFRNNWNVIGLKDYERGARVTPDNQLILDNGATVRIHVGRALRPLRRAQGKTLEDGWLPVVLTTAFDGEVRYDIQLWATPLPSAVDWRQAFDWPTEGENFLNWIQVKVTNTGRVNANAAFMVSSAREDANERFEWSLAPGEAATAAVRIPFSQVADREAFANADADLWHARTVAYWRGVLANRCEIEVPSRKATEALRAAHVCQLIANDHGEVHGGEGFYDSFYIRDGAYQVMELEEAGLWEAARKAVALYLERQREDGRFESQKGQFDANGQAVWVLWQYFKMTQDRDWLAAVYPRMRRAANWTMQARRGAAADSPWAGLLPSAPADGEFLWSGEYHIVGYDFWNLRALLCTAEAARILGKAGEAMELFAEAQAYRAAIDAASKQTGLAYFPPSWEQVGTHWGNTETLWPTAIFDKGDPRVAALIKHVREAYHGGFIEGAIQWHGRRAAIHPYMSVYTTMADLELDNHEQVVEDFYWYLLHSTAAHAFPEGVYWEDREAWSDTIPHVTGACNFAIMLRHMLVHEEGDELHLLKAVPDWWLGEGQEIHVRRAPTHFGEISFVVRGTAEGVRVSIDPPKRNPPARIVLHLPPSRRLLDGSAGVEVAQRTGQKQRWDFEAVVRLYERSDPAPAWEPPDSLSLTTGRPVSVSAALPAHPAYLANDGYANDTDRYWAVDVAGGEAAWWQVDLEEPTSVGRVVVIGYYGDQRYYGFTVETSLDGEKWELVADQRGNKEPATAEGYTCRFAPRPVRFIRVRLTHNSANTGRHLVEVLAFRK